MRVTINTSLNNLKEVRTLRSGAGGEGVLGGGVTGRDTTPAALGGPQREAPAALFGLELYALPGLC